MENFGLKKRPQLKWDKGYANMMSDRCSDFVADPNITKGVYKRTIKNPKIKI